MKVHPSGDAQSHVSGAGEWKLEGCPGEGDILPSQGPPIGLGIARLDDQRCRASREREPVEDVYPVKLNGVPEIDLDPRVGLDLGMEEKRLANIPGRIGGARSPRSTLGQILPPG